MVHRYCGILSAYGLGLADVVQENEDPLNEKLNEETIQSILLIFIENRLLS